MPAQGHLRPLVSPEPARPGPPLRSGSGSIQRKIHRGRRPGVWYASSQEQAAWAELFRHAGRQGVDLLEVRRRVGAVQVTELMILDLTDDAVRTSLAIDEAELIGDDYDRTAEIALAR